MECFVVVLCLDEGKHRAEYLLLSETSLRIYVRDYGWRNEVAAGAVYLAAGNHPALFATHLDIIADFLECLLIDDRTHEGGRLARVTQSQSSGAFNHFLKHLVVNGFHHNGPRAGRALLTLEAECRCHDAVGCGVQIGGLVYDDGIFSAHLEDGPLEPDLSWADFGRALVNPQTYFLRARECYAAGAGMIHQSVADCASGPWDEVGVGVGPAGFAQQIDEHRSDCGRRGGRLQHDCIARHNGGGSHSAHDGGREIPGWDHHTNTQRDVAHLILFAFQRHDLLRPGQ